MGKDSLRGTGLIIGGINWDEFNDSFENHWREFEARVLLGGVARLSPNWDHYETTKRRWYGIDTVVCYGLQDDALLVNVQPLGLIEMDEVYALDLEYFFGPGWLTFHDVMQLEWVNPRDKEA